MNRRNMRRELVTEEALMSELRKRGVHDLGDVDTVRMEPDGAISVVSKEQTPGGGGKSDRGAARKPTYKGTKRHEHRALRLRWPLMYSTG
jgi:uncharacterized membrane protein YcaP (DUF421 family)